MLASARDRAAVYVDLLLRDVHADQAVRALARRLRDTIDDDPHHVISRLADASQAAVYPFDQPDRDLAKAVSMETFWLHYLSDVAKAWQADPVSYGRSVAASPDPSARLLDDLKDDPDLIRPRHAWLAPADEVLALAAEEMVRVLELGQGSRPPFAVLVFHLSDLVRCGVRVRLPRATDAVADEQPQWRLTGLASGVPEWVDRTIPSAAVSSVEWKPEQTP